MSAIALVAIMTEGLADAVTSGNDRSSSHQLQQLRKDFSYYSDNNAVETCL
jgi:hypothetical protein